MSVFNAKSCLQKLPGHWSIQFPCIILGLQGNICTRTFSSTKNILEAKCQPRNFWHLFHLCCFFLFFFFYCGIPTRKDFANKKPESFSLQALEPLRQRDESPFFWLLNQRLNKCTLLLQDSRPAPINVFLHFTKNGAVLSSTLRSKCSRRLLIWIWALKCIDGAPFVFSI